MELDDSVGFRFHPTEQEIISYFLQRKMCYPAWPSRTIPEVKNICKFDPWDLPQRSSLPSNDQVWYFFNVPVSISPNSNRIDRTTNVGFWKLTGRDRPIRDKQGKKEIGYKRNLVFHRGRSPNGIRMNWVMHEYHSNKVSSKEEYVLFRLKRKAGDSSDACDDEPSRHLASDYRNHAAASQDSNFFSQWLSSIQPEQRTSHSNGFDRNSLSGMLSSIQLEQQRTTCSNGLDRNSFSALFSSVQSEQVTTYSNGADFNPFSELFWSIQSEQRPSNSNGADCNPLSELFSSIQQSERRTSYSNGTDRNLLSESFSLIQPSEQRTSNSNGADRTAVSELFSLIQPSEQQISYSNGGDRNPVTELFSSIQQEQGTSYSNGADGNSLSALFSALQQEQGASISIGFNDEWANEQEDAFLYLSDHDEYNGERSIHTVLHDLNPPKSMSGMHIGDNRDTDTETIFTQSGEEFEIPILFNENASSEEYWQVPTARASNGTSSSSVGGRNRGENGIYQGVNMQFDLQPGNSDTEMFETNCLQLAEFPPSPRTCKAQHMPKSHRVIQEKCATERFQLLDMVSSKAISNDEAREAATSVIDLPRKGNKSEKFDKEQNMAQSTNAKNSSKIRCTESKGSNNKKGFTPPLGHKTTPPFVYIGNMLVSFIVILFFIREMCLFSK